MRQHPLDFWCARLPTIGAITGTGSGRSQTEDSSVITLFLTLIEQPWRLPLADSKLAPLSPPLSYFRPLIPIEDRITKYVDSSLHCFKVRFVFFLTPWTSVLVLEPSSFDMLITRYDWSNLATTNLIWRNRQITSDPSTLEDSNYTWIGTNWLIEWQCDIALVEWLLF